MSAAAPAFGPLIAQVAHELRSPLNGIQTWAHVLENQLPAGDAASRRAIAGILMGVDQQVRLIEDLEGAASGDEAGCEALRHALASFAAEAAKLTATGGTIGIELSADRASARISVRDAGVSFGASIPLTPSPGREPLPGRRRPA